MDSLLLNKLSSDDEELLEDTFRPSLFKRIDSESSFQSLDYPTPSIIDPDLSQIAHSGFSKQKEAQNWDMSMLYSQEHEKALILDHKLRSHTAQLDGANRREKFISDKLQQALTKNSSFQEQYLLEIDYLKTKIKYLDQKTQDLNEKCLKLEEKNVELNKDILSKDKKILWLENEVYVKDIKIKGLIEVEAELEEVKKFKENCEGLKEKLKVCEGQLSALRKEKRDVVSGLNIEVANLSEEKLKISKELEILAKKHERLQGALKGNNEVVHNTQIDKENLTSKIKLLETEHTKEKTVIKSILNILKLNTIEEIMPKIESLLKTKNYEKLFTKISNLIIDCSPLGTFLTPPSTTQIWKFIRKVLETYIELTKANNTYTKLLREIQNSESFENVKSVLDSKSF